MSNKKRIELDSLGSKKIDKNRLWGAQTQRSLENFNIGEEKMPEELIKALGIQKKAAAQANIQMGILNKNIGNKIIDACNKVISLDLKKEFPLSIWQTGSGTQTNMNANEVISNYVIKKVGGKIGSKNPVHPNDHVNLSQSSNDTFPTVMHISINELTLEKLLPSLKQLISEISKKRYEFKKIIKIGRTHTQDATPIRLGDEFSAFLTQIKSNYNRILIAKKELSYIAQGGTAVGSGINAPKNFDKIFCKHLNKMTKNRYKPSQNKFEAISSHDSLVNFSNSLKTLSISILKFTNDIRFLSSGPRSGIGELELPANEPGSSIMPGKVNPTQIEALSMICVQVIGNSMTVDIAGSNGHFQLNAFKPVIAYNIIQSVNLLSDGINSFNKNCLKGIKANNKNIKNHLNNTIGYDNAAKIAKKAFEENLTLKEAALKLGLIKESDFDRIVDPKKMI